MKIKSIKYYWKFYGDVLHLVVVVALLILVAIKWGFTFILCAGLPTELSRKHVADMFLQKELEIEARNKKKVSTWVFKVNEDLEIYIQEVLSNAHSSLYSHQESENCSAVGMHIFTTHKCHQMRVHKLFMKIFGI